MKKILILVFGSIVTNMKKKKRNERPSTRMEQINEAHAEHKLERSKMGFLKSLFADDTKDNIMYVFMAAAIIITLLLLSVPIYGLIKDINSHDMIMTDLNGMSAYILSVAGIFTSAGLCTAWTQWSNNKYKCTECGQEHAQGEACHEEESCEECDS